MAELEEQRANAMEETITVATLFGITDPAEPSEETPTSSLR